VADTRPRPHVLWIMADQHRADALGVESPWMHTPNLDWLASQGARLRGMFAQSPVCVPSRCNFVSGRYPHAHRVRENHTRLGPGEPHLFRILKAAGYRTGLVGKNHMFEPRDLAPLDLDGSRVGEGAEDPAWAAHLKAVREDMKNVGSWAGARFHDLPEEGSSTHRIGAASLEALEKFAADGRPFFLWVSFHDPHAPHTAPRRLASHYPPDRVPLDPAALGPTAGHEVLTKAGRLAVKREAQFMPRAGEADLRRYVAVYSAMITYVDEWIGRILARLRALGLDGRTLVLYTSDHGDFRGDHGLVKKDLVLYDCLLNVPCLVRYPGVIPAGRVTPALAEQIDLHPTLCGYAGAEVPKGVQGRSLATLVEGRAEEHRHEVAAEICPPLFENPYTDYRTFLDEWRRAQDVEGHPLRWTAPFNVPGDHVKMIRTRTRKYIWFKRGEEELYDLEADPGEKRNVVRDPKYRPCLEALRMRLYDWHVRSEDPRDPRDDQDLARHLPWGTPTILREG